MRAVEITAFGAPMCCAWASAPSPSAGAGELLIRVSASGINRPDVLQRTGALRASAWRHGSAGAGGGGCCRKRRCGGPGAPACRWATAFARWWLVAATPSGAWRLSSSACRCPRGLTDIEAASLPETFFTVWSNVFDRGRLQAGETLLVQGGTSGIGVTAIQLAKRAMGATVIVTAGSDEKCAACLALGAHHAINYKTQDFVEEAKRITGGKGVDVVLDMVAGDYVAREVECLAEDGRLVIIAVQGGIKSAFNAGLVLRAG
jgi:NADPH2:quinone reductase